MMGKVWSEFYLIIFCGSDIGGREKMRIYIVFSNCFIRFCEMRLVLDFFVFYGVYYWEIIKLYWNCRSFGCS